MRDTQARKPCLRRRAACATRRPANHASADASAGLIETLDGLGALGYGKGMSETRPPKFFRDFVAAHPEVAKAYEALGQAVRQGPLTEREVALVKLALSIGARLEGGAHAHARKALAAGVEPAALEQVTLLAIPTLGFPAAMASRSWVLETTLEKKGEK